jgi:hypothetical protein
VPIWNFAAGIFLVRRVCGGGGAWAGALGHGGMSISGDLLACHNGAFSSSAMAHCLVQRRRGKGVLLVPWDDLFIIRFLSCLVSLECTLGGLFLAHAFAGCRSRPTLYRAEHHTPMGRVFRSYALEPSRGVVRLLHMCCPSSTINFDIFRSLESVPSL